MNIKSDSITRIATCAAIALWLMLTMLFASRSSLTSDEVPHIGAGVSYLQYGDFRMNPEHPPLVKLLSALPVWMFSPPPKFEGDWNGVRFAANPWALGLQGPYGHFILFMVDDVSVQHRTMLARLIPILIGLSGGVVAFLWGRELSCSTTGGLFSAALLLFYPDYLGHACLVTMDVPLLVACAWISWSGWQWRKRPSRGRAAIFIAAICIGSLVKLPATVFSCVMLLTMLVTAVVWQRNRVKLVLLMALLVLVAWWFTAWAAAGFRFSYVAASTQYMVANPYVPPYADAGGLRSVLNFAWKNRLLPETTLTTFGVTTFFGGREHFLLGEYSKHGWYHYFAASFLLKLPLSLFIAMIAALIIGNRHRKSKSASVRFRRERLAILLVPFLVLLVSVVLARINHGHRYILFIYFPLCVLIGGQLSRVFHLNAWKRTLVLSLVVLHVLECVAAFPNYSTYYNIIGGSPYRASQYLRDSNSDWGQDVAYAGQVLNEMEFERANLALFGLNQPEAYGFAKYRWIDPVEHFPYCPPDAIGPPHPDWPTVISVNLLDRVRDAYPREYNSEPDLKLNGVVVYFPWVPVPIEEGPDIITEDN